MVHLVPLRTALDFLMRDIENSALPAMFLRGHQTSHPGTIAPPIRLVHTLAEWRTEMLKQGELDRSEMGRLIGSDKVEGTSVYGADRNRIGSIERVMIDKVSGKVSYAVLGFGGFLGIGNDHYPLPWQSLRYDPELGGYVIGLTTKELEGAPKYGERSDWNWSDAAAMRGINAYYGVPVA
jgi:PRC-barrel domain